VPSAAIVSWPATNRSHEELFRLRKATLYADIIEATGIPVELVDAFTEGQWNMVALIAKVKPPSVTTQAVVRELLQQRQAWRELLRKAA
jgi:ketopantoate reductase